MDLNAPAPDDDENEPPQESPMDTYRREREERKLKMKRLREEEQSKAPVTKVAKTATVISACTASARLKAVGPLPEGWVDCPPFGDSIDGLIPSKVPLADSFNELLEPGMRYSCSHVMRKLKTLGRDVGMVIDLTNTNRYYSSSEWTRNNVKHLKIACRGRDEVPDPGSVNQFVFEVTRYFFQNPGKVRPIKQILVHCTHGHNRTGFMIVHYLVRTKRVTVEQAIQAFANVRPPGIYKEEYIDSLFRFYNERRSEMLVCPPTPEWKRVDLNGEARVDDDGEDDGGIMAALEEDLRNSSVKTNDDVLGDPITDENQLELQKICCWGIGVPQNHGPLRFPGSQPVSLDRKNLQLLRQRYYYATWKADGTRYMLLIVREGCYLIDRNFKFRRVQLRFPMKGAARDSFTETQHCTLLDGEMVIDTNPKDNNKQERRYLVYDVMMLNQKHLTQIPFHERWKLVEKEIIEPRTQDRALNRHYKYDGELFRVRRKDFWMLSTVGKLLKSFIPQLSHEADGLIFQGWDDVYVPRTHEGLLKWKYAHMNSVDFLVKVSPSGSQFSLFLMERGGKFKQLEGARLSFNENVIPNDLNMKVVECSWNKEDQVWVFMRIRYDKETPNAYHVYEKVMGSIADNITEHTLFAEIDEILRLPMYAERIKQEEAQAKKHHSAQQHQGRRG